MNERSESARAILLGLFIFGAVSVLVGFFFAGAAWLSATVLPFFIRLSGDVLFIDLVLGVPLGFVRPTRRIAAWTLYSTSLLFGITLWMLGLILTFELWGRAAAIVGLLLAGVGVVPIAFVATLFKGAWIALTNLVLLTFCTYGARYLGMRWFIKAGRESEQETARASPVDRLSV